MIICAAIKIEFTNQYNIPEKVIIHGLRHGDCYTTIAKMNLPPKKDRTETEGFVDNRGIFYNRLEAYHEAMAMHQLSATTIAYKSQCKENELYSEDLY